MAEFTATRAIDAPAEQVFETVAHIENFEKAIPHITNVEFLTSTRRGVGTRFRETRVMRGREATTELEVTEYIPNERVRLVSDAGGTLWDTVIVTRPSGSGTEVSMVMEARPQKLAARVTTPVISRMIGRAVANDIDAVQTYCEADGPHSG